MKNVKIGLPPTLQVTLLKKKSSNNFICHLNNSIFQYQFGITAETCLVLRKNSNAFSIRRQPPIILDFFKRRLLKFFLRTWLRYIVLESLFLGRTFRVRFSRRRKRLRWKFISSNKKRLYYRGIVYKRHRRKNIKCRYKQRLKHTQWRVLTRLAKTMMKIRPVSRHHGKGIFYKPRIHKKYKQKKNKAVFHKTSDIILGGGRSKMSIFSQQPKEEPPKEYFYYQLPSY